MCACKNRAACGLRQWYRSVYIPKKQTTWRQTNMLFPGCFGMVLTIFQLARTPKTQYTVYKNMVLHKKWCINKSWGSIYSTIHLTTSLWQRDIRQSPAEAPLRVFPAGSPAYHTAYSLSSGFRGINAHTPKFMKSRHFSVLVRCDSTYTCMMV